jgi:MFS family permease
VSDRLDRRKVMVACCTVGVGVSGLFALGIGVPGVAMFALSAALGASITPVYALAMAHVNDHIGSGDRVMASSTVLMLYGLGAMAGPVAASLIMGPLGHRGLFAYIAAAYLFLGLFAIYRMTRRSAAPTEGRKGFEAVGPTPASAPRFGNPAGELE